MTTTKRPSRAEYQREWRRQNPEKARAAYKRANDKRTRTTEQKIAHTLRVRIGNALRAQGLQKPRENSAVRDLGCTIAEFKNYIAQKFSTGMTWANHGEWHLDHVVPLASFDLTDPEQIRAACHHTNLQPLWERDNLSKGAR